MGKISIQIKKSSGSKTSAFVGAGIFCFFAIACSLLCFIGCGQAQKEHTTLGRQKIPEKGEITQEELRGKLDGFREYALSRIMETCDRLDELMPSVRVHKINILHRTRMKKALYTMSESQNPIVAGLETWGLCIRYTEYLRQGQGKSLYGEYQDIAVAGAVDIQNTFELIGKELLKPEVYESTRKQLVDFAKRNPIKGTFSDMIVYATAAQPGVPGAFAKITSVPMAPFKVVQGIDNAATAVYGVKESADRFSDIVEDLPESVKWQILLLLLEVQEIESVKSFSNNVSKISESTAKFADIAENLPGLTDHIIWRLIQVIVLIFMLTLIYKFIIKYLISK